MQHNVYAIKDIFLILLNDVNAFYHALTIGQFLQILTVLALASVKHIALSLPQEYALPSVNKFLIQSNLHLHWVQQGECYI
jgi:hypothetical protein